MHINYDKYNAALTHIERNPGDWLQEGVLLDYRRGCCLLGNAQRLAGIDWMQDTYRAGTEALEADDETGAWLYSALRTLDEFRALRLALARFRLDGIVAAAA